LIRDRALHNPADCTADSGYGHALLLDQFVGTPNLLAGELLESAADDRQKVHLQFRPDPERQKRQCRVGEAGYRRAGLAHHHASDIRQLPVDWFIAVIL
jgi:hypothetical protein